MKILKLDGQNRIKIDIGYKFFEDPVRRIPLSIQIYQEVKFLNSWQGVNSFICNVDEFFKIVEIIKKEVIEK